MKENLTIIHNKKENNYSSSYRNDILKEAKRLENLNFVEELKKALFMRTSSETGEKERVREYSEQSPFELKTPEWTEDEKTTKEAQEVLDEAKKLASGELLKFIEKKQKEFEDKKEILGLSNKEEKKEEKFDEMKIAS